MADAPKRLRREGGRAFALASVRVIGSLPLAGERPF